MPQVGPQRSQVVMHPLFDSISRYASRNTAAPAICGAGRVVAYSELANALGNLCGFFAENNLRSGTKTFVNITDPDLRFVVHLACIHYGLIPFILGNPAQVPGQVDCNLVIGGGDPIVPGIAPELVVHDEIFSVDGPDMAEWGNQPRADSDLMLVATTSGTTGQWKLIGETCGHFTFQLDKTHDYGVGDRIMVIMGELSLMTLRTAARTLYSSATLVRASRDPLTCLRLINIFGVNELATAPKALDRLMQVMDEKSIECPSLKKINLMGSLFTKPLLERGEAMFDAEFFVAYGSSEVGGVSGGRVENATFETGYVGPLRDYLDVRIDSENPDEPGQIVLKNHPVMIQRYYRDGVIVANDDPEYRMPDLGTIRDGCLYVTGRDDEVYNFSGDKIAYSMIIGPLEVDETVGDAAVVSQPDDPDPYALKIAVVASGEVDLERLRTLVLNGVGRRGLAQHLDIRVVDHIPRNASDKVDRARLVELFMGA